jgi:hypothetical protein
MNLQSLFHLVTGTLEELISDVFILNVQFHSY